MKVRALAPEPWQGAPDRNGYLLEEIFAFGSISRITASQSHE
jgi:hypothetical protein